MSRHTTEALENALRTLLKDETRAPIIAELVVHSLLSGYNRKSVITTDDDWNKAEEILHSALLCAGRVQKIEEERKI